jgi:adhesin/invasin
VSDATGPIPNATVTFTVSVVGAGSFTAAAPTDALGQTTVTFTANSPAGDNSIVDITAAAGAVNNSASLTIGTPAPPAPTSLSLSISPLSVPIASQAVVTATVLGATGPAYNTNVTLTITTGATLASFNSGTTQTSIIVTTNSSGVASTPIYTGGTSGSVQVQATVASLNQSAGFLITSDPSSISLNVVNSNLTNGQTTNITATVRNILNNPVTDGTVVNFAITSLAPYAGSLSASSASTINGVASVTFTADASLTGGVIIQATVGTLTPVQAIIIVNAAQAGSLQYVSVTPTSGVISIKGAAGTSDASVVFMVTSTSGAALANQSVNFTLFGPQGATLDNTGTTTSSQSTDSKGQVTTIVHAGYVAGPVQIIASTAVTGPPPATLYASSGSLSIGGGVPSYKWLSLSVQKLNIAGWNCDSVTDTINVNIADRFGNYNILKGTSVSFATDFGAIDTSNVTNDSGQTSSVFRSQDPRLGSGGKVTILVRTTGEENFTDLDADGVYTAGTDTFDLVSDDLPEPYIDTNGNGTHNAGELYFNWPATVPTATSGYNTANGGWDSSIPIWKTVNIWMTGPPDPANSHIECCNPSLPGCTLTAGNITIPNGSYTFCFVFAADVNDNALVGGTKVSLTSDLSDAKITWVSGFETLPDQAGGAPAITGYKVANNNASGNNEFPSISTTIDWPAPSASCGGLKITIPYPGLVTLSP